MSTLKKTIAEITKKHQLEFSQIIRLNSRFLVIKGQKQGQEVVLKIITSNNQYNQDKIGGSLTREAEFLKFLQDHGSNSIKHSLNQIIDYQRTEHSWYLKNWLNGRPQNIIGSGWLFRNDFFNDQNLSNLNNFYQELYQLSDELTPSLLLKFRRSNLESYEKYIDWQNLVNFYGLGKLPIKRFIPQIKTFLNGHRRMFDSQQLVINHFEPYADHLLTFQGKLFIIDWENVGYGDVAHDPVVIWQRAFDKPLWQKTLIKTFSNLPHFKELFDVQLVMQSISNIRYFLDTAYPIDKKLAKRQLELFQSYIIHTLNG
jgi:hypothetical protein